MKKFLGDNLAIILTLSIPTLLTTILALVALFPSFYVPTNYNFIYATCVPDHMFRVGFDKIPGCTMNIHNHYSVIDGKITEEVTGSDKKFSTDRIGLFIQDTKNNTVREITLEEAQSLTLDVNITSPDETIVSIEYDGGFLSFTGKRGYRPYLVRGNIKKRLNNLVGENYFWFSRHGDDFAFIGWVSPKQN